jgi:hypothetical protein
MAWHVTAALAISPLFWIYTEQGKAMQKIIWCGMLGAMICAAVSYLAAGYLGRHSRPRVDPGPVAGDAICLPAEPRALDDLPDPAKRMADWQAFETLDLLSPQGSTNLAKQPDAGKTFGLVPEDSFLQGLAPANLIRSADEAECFRLMPHSECRTPPARHSEAGEDDEEQEAELAEPPVDPKMVEERLNSILQSYLQQRKLNGGAGVDTMEFRPSDAKKGEFDRIPF